VVGRYGDELEGVAMLRKNNTGWAVGGSDDEGEGTATHTLTAHWNGRRWTIVPSPGNGGGLAAVAHQAGGSDYWAVGSFGDGEQPLAMHWTGSAWQLVPVPLPAGADSGDLSGVISFGRHDVWAVGTWGLTTSSAIQFHSLLEHYDGVHWSVVPITKPSGYDQQLRSIAIIPEMHSNGGTGQASCKSRPRRTRTPTASFWASPPVTPRMPGRSDSSPIGPRQAACSTR
jgi:hypothetical protein